jgi:hypothetical protein
METPALLTICLISFVAVLILLSILALIMRSLIWIFPFRENDDAAIIAAINTAYQSRFPGTKIIKIGEQK